MANTYTLIASNTLGSDTASVTFSSIPGTYTDLIIKASVRDDQAATATVIKLQPNGNTTSTNYSQTALRGDGSTASSTNDGTAGGRAYLPGGYSSSNNATASTFANVEIYIPNYAGTAKKPISGVSGAESNTATFSYVNYTSAGLFHDTTAITSIKLLPNAGNFKSGSSFFLYGIKNS